MRTTRRGFIAGLAGLAAPAIIRTPGLLMPVRSLIVPPPPQLDPVLLSLVRQVLPHHIAYDIMGVQPMHADPALQGAFHRFMEISDLCAKENSRKLPSGS